MKKIILSILLLAMCSFAKEVNNQKADYERHYYDAGDHFLMATGFLAAGMLMVPVEGLPM